MALATVSSLASLYGANGKLLLYVNAPRGVLARLIVDMMARLNPQFAFLDIRMPGISGLEAAAAAADTCIVFVTAHDE